MGGSASESPRKRTRRAKKQATPRDLTPASPFNNVDLQLDMSSRMQAMEEYVSQHSQYTLPGNQDWILERSCEHDRLDDAASASGARAAAGGLDSSNTIAPRVADALVPKTVRRKLAPHLRRTPLLVETCTDESEMDEEHLPLGERRRRPSNLVRLELLILQ